MSKTLTGVLVSRVEKVLKVNLEGLLRLYVKRGLSYREQAAILSAETGLKVQHCNIQLWLGLLGLTNPAGKKDLLVSAKNKLKGVR